MAVPAEEWRHPDKRRIIIKKLEEAYSGGLTGIQQSPQELEQAVYDKSKTREEYNHYLQQVLLRLARGRRSGGPTGGNMMQQGGMGMNPTPSYTQPQYSQYSSGVRPGVDMSMGMNQTSQPPGYVHHGGYQRPVVASHPNQPFNQIRMPGQQQMYGQPPMANQGGYTGMPPRYNVHPNMIPGGMMRGQVPGMTQRPNQGVPGMAPVQNPSASNYAGVHSVQAISNPSYTGPTVSQSFSQATPIGMQPSSRPDAPPTSAPANMAGDQSGVKVQQSGPGGNPPTPHPPSMQGGVPSPAPPTPLLPASPATSGVGSPAQQPSITPEENEVYMRKLAELQKYIPLLQKWISKLTKEDRNNQLPKLKQLYSLLSSNNKRVPISTLMRCGEALDKMFNNDQSSRESHSSFSDPTTPQARPPVTTPHSEPVVPQSKLVEPRHSPSLLEFKRVPSPPSNYESLLGAIHTRPLPPERLPPAKRMYEPLIPFGLMRELATISKVKVKQFPSENRFDKSTILQCALDDDGLYPVPPLTIRIPSNYPLVSPVCDLTSYHTSTNSTLVMEVGRTLSERLSRSVHTYSLSSLLSDWEMCVLRAMSNQLLTSDASL
ncbi:mediator of RNA polymerase II transcription subunit 15-like isoform X2 [Halichondria panicea]|uniref:mediator of RNA polymerase II transcription subunit 15-like isoform X2 n=1 Tax=Halichondria panicea TaxID=6063 RepID=UPI00312B5E6F